MSRNHRIFRPFKKSFTDIYGNVYPDAVWLPESVNLTILGDDAGAGRGAVITYRVAKSAADFDNGIFPFRSQHQMKPECNPYKTFVIENEEWDAVYMQHFEQLDSMLVLMRDLVLNRNARGEVSPFFIDAELIDLE